MPLNWSHDYCSFYRLDTDFGDISKNAKWHYQGRLRCKFHIDITSAGRIFNPLFLARASFKISHLRKFCSSVNPRNICMHVYRNNKAMLYSLILFRPNLLLQFENSKTCPSANMFPVWFFLKLLLNISSSPVSFSKNWRKVL